MQHDNALEQAIRARADELAAELGLGWVQIDFMVHPGGRVDFTLYAGIKGRSMAHVQSDTLAGAVAKLRHNVASGAAPKPGQALGRRTHA